MREVRILSARRAYQFAGDAIQVVGFALPEIQQRFQVAFGFQSPPLQGVIPQGGMLQFGGTAFTFQSGFVKSPTGPIPVRYISVDPSRITVDLIGPSEVIDGVFQEIQDILRPITVAGGSMMVGDPIGTEEVSELTAQLDIDLSQLLKTSILESASSQLPREGETLAVTLRLEVIKSSEPYPGGAGVTRQHLIQLRAGSRPADRLVFSSAPLTTAAHTDYLKVFEASSGGPDQTTSQSGTRPSRRKR